MRPEGDVLYVKSCHDAPRLPVLVRQGHRGRPGCESDRGIKSHRNCRTGMSQEGLCWHVLLLGLSGLLAWSRVDRGESLPKI